MQLIEFEDKTYVFDLNRLMQWTIEMLPKEKNNTTSITCIYGDVGEGDIDEVGAAEMGLVHKEESETKSSLNDTTINFRYDMIKNLVTILTTLLVGAEGGIIPVASITELTFPQILAFNTLAHMGILIEINQEEA